jgi:uncharacterized membrane protein YfhO
VLLSTALYPLDKAWHVFDDPNWFWHRQAFVFIPLFLVVALKVLLKIKEIARKDIVKAMLIMYAFVRPLPFLPLWMFMIGFTWAFHILFTLETLTQRQPDVKIYGRIFSWVFIYLANVALVLIWLAAMTPLTFMQLFNSIIARIASAYCGVWSFLAVDIPRLFQG